jgi:hypothetical protein
VTNIRYTCAETGKHTCLKTFAEAAARSKMQDLGIAIKDLTLQELPQSGNNHCVRVSATPKPRWCRNSTHVVEIDVHYAFDGNMIRFIEAVIAKPNRLLVRPTANTKIQAATI